MAEDYMITVDTLELNELANHLRINPADGDIQLRADTGTDSLIAEWTSRGRKTSIGPSMTVAP
jgi:hypothetical protein